MEFIKLGLSSYGLYSYRGASSIAMNILSDFLSSNIQGCPLSFVEWALSDQEYTNGNTVALEKQNGYVLLTDMYSEEEVPTVLRMKQEQFVHLLNEWQEKVCKLEPQEVIIKYENGEFVMETKD